MFFHFILYLMAEGVIGQAYQIINSPQRVGTHSF